MRKIKRRRREDDGAPEKMEKLGCRELHAVRN